MGETWAVVPQQIWASKMARQSAGSNGPQMSRSHNQKTVRESLRQSMAKLKVKKNWHKTGDTLDGRNPAPVDKTVLHAKFCLGFQPCQNDMRRISPRRATAYHRSPFGPPLFDRGSAMRKTDDRSTICPTRNWVRHCK